MFIAAIPVTDLKRQNWVWWHRPVTWKTEAGRSLTVPGQLRYSELKASLSYTVKTPPQKQTKKQKKRQMDKMHF